MTCDAIFANIEDIHFSLLFTTVIEIKRLKPKVHDGKIIRSFLQLRQF